MVLSVRNLEKSYDKVRAVQGISFDVAEGECVGILGANGAGKTTTLEMIEGVCPPTGGTIRLWDSDVRSSFQERIGVQFQNTELFGRQTVHETINAFRMLYRKRKPLDELIEICDLEEILDRQSSKLAGGQRQRLLLALALVNDPDLIFLDEPTTGLDPKARRRVWDIVRSIRKSHGKTLILTTHYLEEAYQLCTRILFFAGGKVIMDGSPQQLLQMHFSSSTVLLPGDTDVSFLPKDLVEITSADDGRVCIRTANLTEVLTQFVDQKVSLAGLEVRSPTLEDLFLKVTDTQEMTA